MKALLQESNLNSETLKGYLHDYIDSKGARCLFKSLQCRRVKIARIAEFTTSNFFTFNDFFHFQGLDGFFKDVKHTILILQKQLIFNKLFRFTSTLPWVRKGSKMHIFILALCKIPTYSKQNVYLDQWNECSKTGKQKCIVIQRTFSTVGRQILSILAIIVYNTHGTAFMQVEFSITDKIVYHRILYFRGLLGILMQ